jgi:hypothetical protein
MKQVQDEFRDINANQIPFATAKSLTMTAQDGQRGVQEHMGEKFVLRQQSFMKKGVRISAATKAKLEAIVGDIHGFMELQETGGTKLPYKEFICVPIIGGARSSLSANIRDDDKPHAVMSRGGFIRNGVMYAVLVRRQRMAKGTQGPRFATRTGDIKPMYVLVHQAHLKDRYQFLATVTAIVQANFRNNFALAFQQAVRTAKR